MGANQRRSCRVLLRSVLWQLVIWGVPGVCMSAGFEIVGQNPLGFTAAFAGGTAVAEDASIAHYNPAAMTGLDPSRRHIAGGAGVSRYSTYFHSDGGSVAPAFASLGSDLGGNGGTTSLIGNAALVVPVSNDLFIGLSILSPFGNQTSYNGTWMGRFHARKADLETLNLTGSLGLRVNEVLSLGFGITRQRAKATLSSAVNYAGVVAGAAAANPGLAPLIGVTPEGSSKISGDSMEWTGNVALWMRPNAKTSVGVVYRAGVTHSLEGNTTFSRTGNPVIDAVLSNPLSPVRGGQGRADLKLPAAASVSISHAVSAALDLLADVTWTEWSTLQDLDIRYTDGVAITSIPFRYRNTVRTALGISYSISDSAKLRAGVAWDPSPVQTAFRNPQLPDSDRIVLSFGGRYFISRTVAADAGVLLFNYKGAPMRAGAESAQATAAKGILSGSSDNSVKVFAVQLSAAF